MRRAARLGGCAVCLIGVTASGCGQEDGDGGAAIHIAERDSAGVTIVEVVGDVNQLTERRLGDAPIVTIDGAAPPYLGNVGEVALLSDGRVVVADIQSDMIHLFGSDGTFVRTLGEKGDGPGEFQGVSEMTVFRGDSIFVFDLTHRRGSVLHPDVGYVRSAPFAAEAGGRPPIDAYMVGVDRIVTLGLSFERPDGLLPRLVQNEARLRLVDGHGQLLAGPVEYPGAYSALGERLSASPVYATRTFVAAGRGWFVHGSGERYELTIRDTDFNPLRMIRWAGWNTPITEEEVEAHHRRFLESATEIPPETLRRLEAALYSPAMLPATRPALARWAFVDERERIWLCRFTPRGPNAVQDWHVIGSDGRPQWRLSLPPGARLAGVKADRVLLLVRDDLDVESLVVYGVES